MTIRKTAVTAMLSIALFSGVAPGSPAYAASAKAESTKRAVAREEKNRALVVEFYTTVLSQRQVDKAPHYLKEDYIQHNPFAPSGRDAFMEFFRVLFAQYPQSEHRIVRTAADGDLVYLHVHAKNSPDDPGRAVMDILRVENGMIVEHWDVVQPVPESAANNNGMF